MEKCIQLTVGGGTMVTKCANIIVNAPLPAIDLTSVTSPASCYVGDTVTVTVTCTNTSITAGIANLTFSCVGTGTPNPASRALAVAGNSVATTTFTYVPTAASTTQAGCANLVSET
jgi:hypothetical protein